MGRNDQKLRCAVVNVLVSAANRPTVARLTPTSTGTYRFLFSCLGITVKNDIITGTRGQSGRKLCRSGGGSDLLGICPMLGSLRFAFSLFLFLRFSGFAGQGSTGRGSDLPG